MGRVRPLNQAGGERTWIGVGGGRMIVGDGDVAGDDVGVVDEDGGAEERMLFEIGTMATHTTAGSQTRM